MSADLDRLNQEWCDTALTHSQATDPAEKAALKRRLGELSERLVDVDSEIAKAVALTFADADIAALRAQMEEKHREWMALPPGQHRDQIDILLSLANATLVLAVKARNAILALSCLMFCLLGACAAPFDVPADAVSMESDPAVELARAYWAAYKLPDTEDCAAPLWVETDSFNLFAEACTHTPESCGDPSSDLHHCALACTTWADDGRAFATYAGGVGRPGIGETLFEIRAHETMHALSQCAFGDPDGAHARAVVWSDAMHWIREQSSETDG